MKKHHVGVLVESNALVDEGDGVISFPKKLVITDNSEQRNGTKYDIPSMDLSEYKGQITADHTDMLQSVIGKVKGLAKVGNKVVIEAIQYAVKESAYARLAYDLLKGGFSESFSIETYGSLPDKDGIYRDARLIGLSQVVVGNNRNATVNKIVLNSIEQAKKDGLDVDEVEKEFLTEVKINQNHSDPDNNHKDKEDMKFVTIKNSRDFAVMLKFKNAAGDEVEKEVEPGESVDVSEDQKDVVENQLKEAKKPEVDVTQVVKEAVEAATKPLSEELKIFKEAFDKGASEPEFQKAKEAARSTKKNEFSSMSWEDRAVNQIESFRLLSKHGNQEAGATLQTINEVNLEALKEKGLVKNAISIGDLGNYVISPEQLTEIVGFRSDYAGLVETFTFRDTLSTVTQWLKRSGDIDMTHVDYDDAALTGAGYLKPVKSYSATLETMELEELAAVTPVANSATRFLAADILADVNQGYRTDYQRKLAQLIVARLEQAVDGNGNSEVHNTNTDLASVKDFANLIGSVAEKVPNGRLIMNYTSYWKFVARATGAGISGPLANLVNTGNQPNIFGIPVTVVPNDLMPDLDDSATVTHVIDNANVTINHAVFYINPTNFVGRTSGGLMYDLSTDAAYESGGSVYSAFQRNQIVLRGAFFRGGEVSDTTAVAGVLAPGVS